MEKWSPTVTLRRASWYETYSSPQRWDGAVARACVGRHVELELFIAGVKLNWVQRSGAEAEMEAEVGKTASHVPRPL